LPVEFPDCTLQSCHERRAIHPVLPARILDVVEYADRTADAFHPELEKHADRLRPPPHDVVD
jgi:hypothetical protein